MDSDKLNVLRRSRMTATCKSPVSRLQSRDKYSLQLDFKANNRRARATRAHFSAQTSSRLLTCQSRNRFPSTLDTVLRKLLSLGRMSQAETKAAFSDPVGLNVGGQIYTTSLSTLTKYSESMLGAMFSGRFPLKQDANGDYFIDRDGSLFGYVLEFLRNGQLQVLESERGLHLLLKEAEFFRIPALEEAVKQQIADEAGQGIKWSEESEVISLFCRTNGYTDSISGRLLTLREVLHIDKPGVFEIDVYDGQSERPECLKTGKLTISYCNSATVAATVVQTLEGHGFVTIKKSGRDWILSRPMRKHKPGSDWSSRDFLSPIFHRFTCCSAKVDNFDAKSWCKMGLYSRAPANWLS